MHAYWRTVDRIAAALRRRDVAEAKRLYQIAVRQHHGPYEESSLRSWQEQIERTEAQAERIRKDRDPVSSG